jgi:isopropylmalate/homocitrate/citramalate synthase
VRQDPQWRGRTIDDGVPHHLRAEMRERMVARVLESLRHATRSEAPLQVDFAAEDASRADPDFLAHCLRSFAPFIDHFLVCDTVGVLRPDAVAPWIGALLRRSGGARLGVHFHNDMGLALENTLRAVLAGATMVSGTFGGIGERAGNVALDQVLAGLQWRHGIRVEGIDYDAVPAVTTYLRRRGMEPAAPYSRAAQRHMSGMHVQSLLQDRQSYCVFPDAEPEIWFGKMSGTANFQYLFEKQLGRPLPQGDYRRLSARVKRRAQMEERCFSAHEVLAMVESGALDAVA